MTNNACFKKVLSSYETLLCVLFSRHKTTFFFYQMEIIRKSLNFVFIF